MPEEAPVGELRSLVHSPGSDFVEIIDQTRLPHQLLWVKLRTLKDFCVAIETMQVRGAPLIGVTAAYGLAFAAVRDPSDSALRDAASRLRATRPTAVNLHWALQRMSAVLEGAPSSRAQRALAEAQAIAAEDIRVCRQIGEHGLDILRDLADARIPTRNRPLQLMTHCNAGWLAALEWGTALAPVYAAAAAGLDVHVWVSETRPRNQGASLSSWELGRAGIANTVIADNAAGHLMQRGEVDCVIVGSDRTAANGDVCNKIGTYLKALAAAAASVPFYVALPSSTVDWDCRSGSGIPIEQRGADEILVVEGLADNGERGSVRLAPADTDVFNPAFDVTPANLVSGLLTEYGCFQASDAGLSSLRKHLSGES